MHTISNEMKEKSINFSTYLNIGQRFGLPIGLFWFIIFLCSMYSFQQPWLGMLGNILSFVCLITQISMMKFAQLRYGQMNFLQRWSSGLQIGLHTALVTTAGQYIYFRFFDNGHLCTTLTNMLNNSEYQEIFKQAMPEMDMQSVTDNLVNTSLSDLTLSLLTFNLFLGFVLSIITAMFSHVKMQALNETNTKDNQQEQNSNEEIN